MKLLTETLRSQIGQTASYTAPEPLGRAAIRCYAVALDDPDARHRSGDIAPRTLICETNQYVVRDPDDEGYAGHSWDLEVPGALQVRGGNRYEFYADAGPDTIVTATWALTDMNERVRRDGRPLLIVTSEARYTDQHDTLLAVNTETLIYVGDES